MDTIKRAGQFFESNGRDIDKALFEYHFGGAPMEQLLDVLSRYQNPDGGFGRALEPDLKAPDSNPFATELALLICIQAGVPRTHELLRRTVEYLESSQDEDGSWRFTPGVYEHEMAPWFRGWEWPALNPSCTIAGHLKELGLGSEKLHSRVAALFSRLARPQALLQDDYYTTRPYAYYFLPEWEHPQRELYVSGVLWWLIRQHAEGRGVFFDFIRNRHTYTGTLIPKEVIEEGLDAVGRGQAEDGGWPTPYDAHWRGWTTVENLLVLRQFGKL
ncbi:MAG: hypothetical protein M3Q29_10820 [Chloroflexota bacterium]|nr:hypothetical protein [Chloroflexota bacterium]